MSRAPRRLPSDIGMEELVPFFEADYFCWDGKSEPIGYAGQYTDFPDNRRLVQMILDRKPRSVLDLGCARGFIVKMLNQRGVPAWGIDVSRYCHETRVTENQVLGNIVDMHMFDDKQFDLGVSFETFEHIPEKYLDKALAEVARVCERAFISCAYEESVTPTDTDITHINIKPWEWWLQKLKPYGFELNERKSEPKQIPYSNPPANAPVGLNLGSFVNMFLDTEETRWINVDILGLGDYAKAYHYNFIQHDVSQGIGMPDGSFSYIFMSQLLEHFPDPQPLLKECLRVLKPGGVIRVSTPDLKLLTSKYLKRKMGQFDVLNKEYAGKKSQSEKFWYIVWSGHRNAFDKDSLKAALEEAGFTEIEQAKPFRSRSPVIERETYDQYPTLSLYVEAQKPVKPEGFAGVYDGRVWMPSSPITVVTPPARERLKIGLISTPFLRTPPDAYGGLEQIVADLAKALAAKGHDVTVFAADGSRVEGCKVVEFGPPALKVQVDWLKAERAAYQVYKEMLGEFDVVHGHNWFGYEYAAKASNPALKVLHTHHGGLNLDWWKRSSPPFKLNLVSISRWMADVYKAQGFTAKPAYNGVDMDRYPFKAEKGDRLLFVGRIDRFKQPDIAIQVAKKLGVGLDIVGGTFVQDPAYLAEIRAMCDGSQVKFYPDAPHQVKLQLLQNAWATLFPSRMGEPFGLVPVESMLCGTPVIALNDGAVEEVVQEGGVVCDVFEKTITPRGPAYNVKRDAVEAMVEALKKPFPLPQAARRNGERFSKEAMASSYLALYDEVLGGAEW